MKVAVKFVRKDGMPEHGYFKGLRFTGLTRFKEAETLKVLDHPCIVKLLDVFEDDVFAYFVCCSLDTHYILMPYLFARLWSRMEVLGRRDT